MPVDGLLSSLGEHLGLLAFAFLFFLGFSADFRHEKVFVLGASHEKLANSLDIIGVL